MQLQLFPIVYKQRELSIYDCKQYRCRSDFFFSFSLFPKKTQRSDKFRHSTRACEAKINKNKHIIYSMAYKSNKKIS